MSRLVPPMCFVVSSFFCMSASAQVPQTPNAAHAPAECEVWTRELSFARTVAARPSSRAGAASSKAGT